MPGAAKLLFLTSLFIIIYTYAGYPLLLFALTRIKKLFFPPQKAVTAIDFPAVTLIVTAYNEQGIIREKIINCLGLNYPRELLTTIFVTDGSTDDTTRIAREYTGITVLHEPARKGKLAAMNRAVLLVKSPIIVFSDANTFLNDDAIKKIVRHYSDPQVGGVAGEKRILQKEDSLSRGEGFYWRYESLLKRLDSDLNTTMGAAGELFSIRTPLYSVLPPDTILEDFVQSMQVCLKNYVVRYEPDAFAAEPASASLKDEMERKIRISAGGFQAISRLKPLLNFFRLPIASFQFISHRILRWAICPPALVILFISSIYLCLHPGSIFYAIFFCLQAIFYILGMIGWRQALKNKHLKLFSIPFYFLFMNACVFAGFWRYINDKQGPVWEKAKR